MLFLHARPRPAQVFPPGSHATATWTIPQDYGGMTAALLRRARMFVREAGSPVRILTFDAALDVDAARERLTARGELVPGVTLHNFWEDLRNLPDDALGVRSDATPEDRPRSAGASELTRTELDDEGNPRRVLRFRADGTLVATDERGLVARRLTLFARDGREGRHWNSMWGAYRHWVSSVLPSGPAYVVVDSKALVNFFATYHRKDTYTLHVVHGAHLSAAATDTDGPLTASRKAMVEHFDDFDGVVFLTDGQRRDVIERIGPRPSAFVVPNSTDLPEDVSDAQRDLYRGAVLASLHRRKRVPHAIRAVGSVARSTGLPLTLDVYGDGPERSAVEEVAAKVPGVTMHGYVPGAADRLVDASFLLLTSRSEGLPLVFAEAMSRGCVPIAYDIRYGPGDIITDGVDGFLVPSGDVRALTRAVERFVTMDDADVARMRAAAKVTAQNYSDASVVQRWGTVFRDVTAARRQDAGGVAQHRPPGVVRRSASMAREAVRSLRRKR